MEPDAAPRPTLILNPAADDDFRICAESLLADGAAEPGTLQAGLRRRFPRALVRPRERAGERVAVWYVYREGHWVGRES